MKYTNMTTDPFDFTKRIILPANVVRQRLMRGEGVSVFLDFESSGLDRQKVPYATPNYPFITEAAFTVSDLHGNYYQTKKIYLRQPDDLEGDIAAKLVTRLQGHDDWSSKDRIPYPTAIAATVYYLRQQESSYGDIASHYGDIARKISFRDYNRAFHNNDDNADQAVTNSNKASRDGNGLFYKPESAWAFDIPAWDPDKDQVISIGRYFPGRGEGGAYALKVSEKAHLADGSKNPAYGFYDNGFHIDQETGEKYVWVGRSLGIDIFNAPFDSKLFAANLQRVNYFARDAAMLYSRAMRGPRQEGRWYIRDTMELARAVAKYGPQDESALKFGEYFDFDRGRPARTKTQASFLEANKRSADPYRLIRPGIISPQDGSLHDPHKDHDGDYDTVWGFALARYARMIAPELAILQDKMAVRDNQDVYLNAQDPDGHHWPFFVLPVKNDRTEEDGIYLYIGSDVNVGDMNKRIFLRLDEDLEKYAAMSPHDWADFIKGKQTIVKQEKKGEHHLPLSLEYVRAHSAVGATFQSKDPLIVKNLKLLGENPEFRARIMAGIEIINFQRRFENHSPAIPLPEDEFYLRNASGVNFQDYHRAFQSRLERASTPQMQESIRATRDMIKRRMDDDFQYMTKISRAIMYMAGLADMIDSLGIHTPPEDLDQERDKNGMLTPNAERYSRYFLEYREKCTRLFRDVLLEQNEKPLVAMLRSLRKKDDTPFFDPDKPVLNIYNLSQAIEFRDALCSRILHDRAFMMAHEPDHPHLQGFANVDDFKTRPGSWGPLMILPDPTPGEKQGSSFGAPPFIRDKKTGHRIEPEDIARLSTESDGQAIIRKMVEDQQWEIAFYSFRSDALIKGVIKRCLAAHKKELIPEALYGLYVEDWTYRKLGFPNEAVPDSRIPTLRTQERDLQAIMVGARDSKTLEAAPPHLRRVIDMVMKHEEGSRLVAQDLEVLQDKIRQAEKVRKGLRVSRYDRESNLPLDYIPYMVDRNSSHNFLKDPNYVVLDVSAWQMRQALDNTDPFNGFPLKGLAIANISKKKREAIEKGKPVLFRVIETGQIYSGGHASLASRPLTMKGGLQDLFQTAAQQLDDAGMPLKQKDTLYFVGIDKLMPVAGTRHVDYTQQTLLLPHSKWYSLTMPELFGAKGSHPIVTHIAPADYVRQRFSLGKPLLLCHSPSESYAEIHGNANQPFGETYVTTLKDGIGINRENGAVEGITFEDFEGRIRRPENYDRYVTGAGFLSADHFNAIRAQWSAAHGVVNPQEQRLVALTFSRVNKAYQKNDRDEELNSWGYAPLARKPEAALRIDGRHYPPNPFQNVPDPSQ